jgi:hypothetical protein
MSRLFRPEFNTGRTFTPAATTARVDISSGDDQYSSVELVNLGANICYVSFGDVTVTASTADFPVLAGERVNVRIRSSHKYIAHISTAGTTLHFIFGYGG